MSERAKRLLNYIFPAVGGMFATYLYNVVDGVFVGQGVGAAALGAVNIGGQGRWGPDRTGWSPGRR